MSAGFVAGTLVHADKGLIPIQNLKVGDLVLTLPKNAIAKRGTQQMLEYQPVTKISKSPDVKPLIMPIEESDVICIDSSKFWNGECWVEAGQLDRGYQEIYSLMYEDEIYYMRPAYYNNRSFSPLANIHLVATQDSQIAIVLESNFSTDGMSEMNPTLWKFDSEKYQPIVTNDLNSYLGNFMGYEKSILNNSEVIILDKNQDDESIQYYGNLLKEMIEGGDIYPFQRYVFDIEIKNTHCYFVQCDCVLVSDSTI